MYFNAIYTLQTKHVEEKKKKMKKRICKPSNTYIIHEKALKAKNNIYCNEKPTIVPFSTHPFEQLFAWFLSATNRTIKNFMSIFLFSSSLSLSLSFYHFAIKRNQCESGTSKSIWSRKLLDIRRIGKLHRKQSGRKVKKSKRQPTTRWIKNKKIVFIHQRIKSNQVWSCDEWFGNGIVVVMFYHKNRRRFRRENCKQKSRSAKRLEGEMSIFIFF